MPLDSKEISALLGLAAASATQIESRVVDLSATPGAGVGASQTSTALATFTIEGEAQITLPISKEGEIDWGEQKTHQENILAAVRLRGEGLRGLARSIREPDAQQEQPRQETGGSHDQRV